MSRTVVIAVDSEERTVDALALGRLLVGASGLPGTLVSVFPYAPLSDPQEPELARLRDEARDMLLGLAAEVDLPVADAEVIAGNFAARELQHVTERPETALIVVGSTMRGPVGRLLIGGVGERLLAGAASPVAIAPRGFGDAPPDRLGRIGVGIDGSDEAQHARDAAIAFARASGAALRVITVFQPLAFGTVTTGAIASTSANQVARSELHEIHERALAAVPEGIEVEGRFLDGQGGHALSGESGELDLLVVGSRGYGPLGAVLMGSVTAELVRSAASPILVTPRGTRLDLTG